MTSATSLEELGLSYGTKASSFALERRSRVRGAAALVAAILVAVLCVLALVHNDGGHEVHRGALSVRQMLVGASSDEGNGGASGEAASTGGAADFIKNSDLGDYVDAIIGPAPSGLTEGGYKKRGSIAVSKIDAAGFYYLNVEGEPGHAIKCILQGSDGYHRHWKGYGQIYTGPIHEGNYGGKDYLQIQDLVSGEVEYFRFRFT
eukprot:CAMPEP_0206247382 /NCGR_PEP_ID=MMETSP0047_2-20121206/19781_1 /ASSEMBLY_ACC=CAM_ASM_000192 /TAXON_ID=195065 /ORGANISM="Chroomonas mesostigmatica_cf, Strain CCMP1168" /LENGTH=203 /DNA_ID=CAMNT_0053672905 /DNA_START=23 /DNA_END=634 /DNA_ORIENTATION=+